MARHVRVLDIFCLAPLGIPRQEFRSCKTPLHFVLLHSRSTKLQMQVWRYQFNASKRRHDFLTQAFALVTTFGPALKKNSVFLQTRGLATFAVFAIIRVVILGTLMFLTPSWFLKRRTGLLVACQLVTLSSYYYLVFLSPVYNEFLRPLLLPADFLGRLRFMLFVPMFLIQVRCSSMNKTITSDIIGDNFNLISGLY